MRSAAARGAYQRSRREAPVEEWYVKLRAVG
jgi:hypothetical protein